MDFEKVWGTERIDLREGAMALWRGHGVMRDEERMRQRAGEVVYVVTENGKVCGVSTAVEKRVALINNQVMFEFRCFIAPENRLPGLDVKLSKLTFDFLEDIYRNGKTQAIGIVAVLENSSLKNEKVWRRAVWPVIDMVFAGFTKEGDQIRVHYFKGARIS